MTITVSGRKMPVTDALRQYAEEKVGNAIKAVDADTVSTEIVLYNNQEQGKIRRLKQCFKHVK